MSDNWVVQNLQNALDTWNKYLTEIWQLITQSPEQFKGGTIWSVIVNIHDAVRAIGLALLALFAILRQGGSDGITRPLGRGPAADPAGVAGQELLRPARGGGGGGILRYARHRRL